MLRHTHINWCIGHLWVIKLISLFYLTWTEGTCFVFCCISGTLLTEATKNCQHEAHRSRNVTTWLDRLGHVTSLALGTSLVCLQRKYSCPKSDLWAENYADLAVTSFSRFQSLSDEVNKEKHCEETKGPEGPKHSSRIQCRVTRQTVAHYILLVAIVA